ncbi:HD-GYP domain-containing protein [Brevibacillus ruminantium]|uniref:HD-GYP domain-containing protein n=1 Tax=Brevibacillus ruminantium TaxID=2950604 RepID=A0ABY4WI04_9BACL|nr:HD-GYP domain-containing protein [Brevibacillus ruminantium]USG66778.1 HD-GYP domain-containing protein [Brevibacillus ruminantium]
MRLRSIQKCKPGQTLARSVYAENGTILVGSGVELTQRMIDRLIRMNVTNLYIQDNRTEDIQVEATVSEATRREAMGLINEAFRSSSQSPQKWQQMFSDKQFGRQIRQVLSTVADELKGKHSAMNLLADACAFDHYIFAHSFNVMLYSTALALKSDFGEKEVLEIGIGAMLHDIGKMSIPDTILKKPGRLTDEEFVVMKRHTEIGFEMLRRQEDIPLLAAHCAFQHHERLDGTGYPRRLKGDEIHPYAKLMAVCDVFDALTTHRVYRPPMLPHDAMELLYTGADILYDKEYVERFRDTIALYPLGLSVVLNTKESGVVVDYNKGTPSRPVVRILYDENGQPVEHPYEYDLSKRLHLMIVSCDELF